MMVINQHGAKDDNRLTDMIFETPRIDALEASVLDRLDEARDRLRPQLTPRRRWVGLLRRLTIARAVLGSNTVEGYTVRLDEAMEAVEGEVPANIDAETRAAYAGYVDAATYALQLGDDPDFRFDESLVRSLHYMMLKDADDKSPGRWRRGPVFVEREETRDIVYTGPDYQLVPGLMREYVAAYDASGADHVMVRAAMAHLNLSMIHPFRDGNGRMARCMQTLLLARQAILSPPFWGIEEYVGENTESYYDILAAVGQGSWHPERDARPWVRWVLRAHFHQAHRLERRADEARRRWEALSEELATRRLPERATVALFNAALGLRVRNVYYRGAADVTDATATRDLMALSDAGLLVGNGPRKSRFYVASPSLLAIEQSIKSPREPIPDPFAVPTPTVWSIAPTATTTAMRQPPERSPSSAQD